MASQLGRHYCPPPQSGMPMTNAPNKNHDQPQMAEPSRDELLVKQTYWDYEDFMNTNIRNPPKKCYYEMMSRDEFNIRQDLCKDLETKRNHIIDKIERSSHDSSEDVNSYGGADMQSAVYNTSPQMSIPEMEHPMPSLQQQQQHVYQPSQQRRPGVNRPIENDNNILQGQSQNQNQRPRSLPYHMRSGSNLQPRPGPGVVTQMNTPPNEASNMYYSYINSMQADRQKSSQYRHQAPHSTTAAQHSDGGYSNKTVSNSEANKDSDTENKANSTTNSSNDVCTKDKFYEQSVANIRAKPVQRFSPSLNTSAVNGLQYTPISNNVRYQYQQPLVEPVVQEVHPTPLLPQYDVNQPSSNMSPYSAPKVTCKVNQCPSSCSCSSRENKQADRQVKKITRYSGQNVLPTRLEPDRQYRATNLDSAQPNVQQNQYMIKPDTRLESSAMHPRQQTQYEHDRSYNSRQQPMVRSTSTPMPHYDVSGNLNQQRATHYNSVAINNQQPHSQHQHQQQQPATQSGQPMATNMKPRRPNMMPSQSYQYPLQARNTSHSANALQQQQVGATQPGSQGQVHSTNGLQQVTPQPYCSSSNPTMPQPSQLQNAGQPQALSSTPTEIRKSSVPPSEPVHSDVNGNTSEGYDDYTTDYERQLNSGKQLYITKSPPKARKQPPYKYNWTPPQVQCDNGDTWNGSTGQQGFCCSDTDNCDIDEGEEEDDDETSW